jgi:uroporphyrinogen-III synthase
MLLLTRPQGQNQILQEAFESFGIATVQSPVFQIRFLKDFSKQEQMLLKNAQHVIVTSIHGLHVLSMMKSDCCFYVVGSRTANELRGQGFENIKYVAQTAHDLWEKLLKRCQNTDPFLFLSGNRVSMDFSCAPLKHGNFNCQRLQVYQTFPLKKPFTKILPDILSGKIRYVCVLSDYTAQQVAQLFEHLVPFDRIKTITCLAFSEKIRQTLLKLPWQKIWVSPGLDIKMFCSSATEMILKNKRGY